MSLIVKIGADTREYNKQIKKMTKDIRDVSKELEDIGSTMTTSVSAPLAALGVGIGLMATQFDNANGRIQAQLGITGKEAEELGDIAKDLWAEGFGESVDEVARAIANVSQNMKDLPNAELENVAKMALTVAKAFDQDVNEVTKTANQLMTNFGMSSDLAFDMMTKGFQNGMNFSGELLDTFNEYAPQFAKMGFTGEQMFNTLAAGAAEGAFNLDKVGDAVKEFGVRAIDGSKNTSEAFAALNMDAGKMASTIAAGGPAAQQAFSDVVKALASVDDPVKRGIIGVQLFGTQFEDLGPDVIAAMSMVEDSIEGVEGSTARAGDALGNTFGARFQSTLREMQVTLEPVGMALLNIADYILPKIASAVASLADWWNGLSSNTQQFIGVMAGLLIVVGPLATLASWVVKIIGFFKVLWAGIAAGQGIFAALATAAGGSVVLIVAGIVAVIAIVAALIIYWDEIKAVAIKVWKAVSDAFKSAWDAIKNAVKTGWDFVKKLMVTAWNYFLTWTPFGIILKTIIANWETIKTTVRIGIDMVKALLQIGANAFKSIWNPIWTGIKNFITPIWDGIRDKISSVTNSIKTVVSTGFNFIKDKITGPLQSAKTTVLGIIDAIKNAFNKMKITIPKPKIPKISVTTGTKKVAGVSIPYPSFSVDWFKTGGVFNGPQVVGLGESGPEAIVPLQGHRMSPFAEAIAGEMPDKGNGEGTINQVFNVNATIRQESDIKKVAQELFNLQKRTNRRLGY